MDVKFLRELAVRCQLAARNCFDLKGQQQLREIGEELSKKADELEGKPHVTSIAERPHA
jgi:hypothetical protein